VINIYFVAVAKITLGLLYLCEGYFNQKSHPKAVFCSVVATESLLRLPRHLVEFFDFFDLVLLDLPLPDSCSCHCTYSW